MKKKNGPVKIYFDPAYIVKSVNEKGEVIDAELVELSICTRNGQPVSKEDAKSIRKFIRELKRKGQ